MRILITGGFGYLGGRISQFLASKTECEILLGSRYKSELPGWIPQGEVVQTYWESSVSLEQVVKGVDIIVHSAGMNAQDCAADPIAALAINGLATGRLLEAAKRQGVKRIIYLSTAHVYASPLTGVITETTCPINLHPYATSHRAAEDVVRLAHLRGEIKGIVVRLSNSFGVPVSKDASCWMLLANDLCRQAVTTKRMVLYSTGLQRRDFVTVENVVRAIFHLVNLSEDMTGNGVFNVGGKWVPQVIEMVELIQSRCSSVLGFKPEIVRPKGTIDAPDYELEYCIDKLLATGFTLEGSFSNEIDATLLLCQNLFGK